jgi:putative transposon-encoded protein
MHESTGGGVDLHTVVTDDAEGTSGRRLGGVGEGGLRVATIWKWYLGCRVYVALVGATNLVMTSSITELWSCNGYR